MNTRVGYLYRDAANYKRHGSALLRGEIGASDVEEIKSKLDMGEHFVAEQVGLASLRDEGFGDGVVPSCLDHGWHTLVSICCSNDAGPTLMTASAFVARFAVVQEWKLSLANDFA